MMMMGHCDFVQGTVPTPLLASFWIPAGLVLGPFSSKTHSILPHSISSPGSFRNHVHANLGPWPDNFGSKEDQLGRVNHKDPAIKNISGFRCAPLRYIYIMSIYLYMFIHLRSFVPVEVVGTYKHKETV